MSEVASRERPAGEWLLLGACAVAVAFPFLAVAFPPVTDLPQHAVQIRLLGEALGDARDLYTVQWATPYGLSYALVGLFWAVAGPLASGRLAMMAIGLLWAVALLVLARRHARPGASAVLATLFFFSRPTYWGLYSFVLGFPLFVLFVETVLSRKEDEEPGLTDGLRLFCVAVLLYFCHALWFAAGVGWFLVRSVLSPRPLPSVLRRAAPLLPVLLGAAVWLRFYAQAGGGTPPRWDVSGRLSAAYWVDAFLGGLRGPIEPIVLLAVLAWVAAGVWQARGRPGLGADRELALAGALLLAAALFGPDAGFGTLHFGTRWTPPAAALLVLAAPAPRIRPSLAAASAVVLLLAFSSITTRAWQAFEEEDLSGLPEALSRLPEKPAVLGLDLVGVSERVKGRPFLNVHAYAQLLRGGTLNFSCARIPTSLVVFRPGVADRFGWNPDLPWNAVAVTPADVLPFDFALVNALPKYHPNVPRALPLLPVTHAGAWRLYQVVKPPRAPGGAGPG